MEKVLARPALPFYTKGEEIFNAVSHIVGGGIGVIAWFILVWFAYPDPVRIAAGSVFGFGVVLLYTMSALYHFLPQGRGKRVFRIFDHCTIFILIACSYTPYCLIPLYGTPLGWSVLAIEWTAAVVGITFKAIFMNSKAVKILSMVLYVLCGWLALLFLPVLPHLVCPACLWLLLAGGIAYTAGITFYALGKRVRYFHSIWHLFTILGTVLQFVSILLMM